MLPLLLACSLLLLGTLSVAAWRHWMCCGAWLWLWQTKVKVEASLVEGCDCFVFMKWEMAREFFIKDSIKK